MVRDCCSPPAAFKSGQNFLPSVVLLWSNEKSPPIWRWFFSKWWTQRDSNPRPLGCEPNALPTGSLICTTIPVEASMYLSLKIDHCRVIVGKMYMASVNFQDAAIQTLFYKLYPIHSWDVNATAAIRFASSLRAVENWRFRTIYSHPKAFSKHYHLFELKNS